MYYSVIIWFQVKYKYISESESLHPHNQCSHFIYMNMLCFAFAFALLKVMQNRSTIKHPSKVL